MAVLLAFFIGFGLAIELPMKTDSHASISSSTSSHSSEGLRLEMSLDESSLSLGGAIGIGISEYNAIASHIKVPAAQVWTGKVLGLGAQCGRPLLPMGIAIYPGHYVAANISQGTPLRIFQSVPAIANRTAGSSPDCASSYSAISYEFLPESSIANITYAQPTSAPPLWGEYRASAILSLKGYYLGSFVPFGTGSYTVQGGDEWGRTLFDYFSVA